MTFPICFSFFKPKTSLFFKHTLKVIISVIAVAILLGFSIIFPPLYDKIVSSIFLMVTYVITDERLVLFMYQVKYLFSFTYAAAAAKLLQSCLTLCDLIDGSPPGSSVSRILQARILEWVAISFSNTCMHAKPLQSCPTLCDPMDKSPPGSYVHRILQARILEWVAISFSIIHTCTYVIVFMVYPFCIYEYICVWCIMCMKIHTCKHIEYSQVRN